MTGRYASALFDLAKDRQQTDQVGKALTTFDSLITESPDLDRLVRSPVFSAADQIKGISAVLERVGIRASPPISSS